MTHLCLLFYYAISPKYLSEIHNNIISLILINIKNDNIRYRFYKNLYYV